MQCPIDGKECIKHNCSFYVEDADGCTVVKIEIIETDHA